MVSLSELEEAIQKLQADDNLETHLKNAHHLILKFVKEGKDLDACSDVLDKYYRFCASLTFLQDLDLGFSSLLSVLRLVGSPAESFPLDRLHQIIEFIFSHPKADQLVKLFGLACSSFSDLRYYSLKYLLKSTTKESGNYLRFLESLDLTAIVDNLHRMYIPLDNLPSKIADLRIHRGVYTKYVLLILKSSNSFKELEHKKIISLLDEDTMKFMTRPSLLADYFSEAFKNGGLIGLLSLSGLFYLIRKHNLEYKSFYDKLYTLLSPELFGICKYRKRFLKLISVFMRSTHISDCAYGSILKKISELSLGAPPHSLRWIIPFLYNAMKNKPRLRGMIHNDIVEGEWTDPYDPKEGVETSHAEKSSLWEIETIGKHYYGPISSSMKIFSERLVRPPYDLGKSLDENSETLYSILKRELGFKWTKKPPTQLEFAPSIF